MTKFASKAEGRRHWMAKFEIALVKQSPAFAGRVPWGPASFHFNMARSPVEAAAIVAASEAPVASRF